MTALRVLLVEDDAMIGEVLLEMLQGMGYAVCPLETTEADAVAAAARCKPGLIIMDSQLAEGSGVTAIESILCGGFVPHLFMSGNVAKILARRPDAITLQKPFQEAALTKAIRQALAAVPA